ncbi:MAG: hypothetical protein Q8T03_13000 [Bacteroidota bacterium]|nr:hypothetical protein [Bacteroidota bacterium]
MRKVFFLFFCIISINLISQEDTDSLVRSYRTKYHYVGVQANLLLQQFLNFNSNSFNSNPYLFSYSFNYKQNGNGMVIGTGLSASNNFSNDGVVEISDDRINVTGRVGIEKKFYQEETFIPFIGFEVGLGYTEQKLKTKLVQTINNPETNSKTTKFFFGPALRGGLLYSLNKYVKIGTEFYFNFQVSVNKSRTITTSAGQQPSGTNTTSLPINFGLQAPTALFLIYRF